MTKSVTHLCRVGKKSGDADFDWIRVSQAFPEAADLGHEESIRKLIKIARGVETGRLYVVGIHASRALSLLERAAEFDVDSLATLGFIYKESMYGSDKHMDHALTFLLRAASKGYFGAAVCLCTLTHGRHITCDDPGESDLFERSTKP